MSSVLNRLESQGFFDRARTGDHRACGLFARLAAYELNPNGDTASWGCLRKTAGGANVDGYSEDAIVLGADPSNTRNVADLIIGAGAPGARLVTSLDSFVPRRSADVWEAPTLLSAADMDYLKPGSGHVEPNPPVPVPVPPPSTSCRYQAINLEGLATIIQRLHADVLVAADEARQAKAEVVDLSKRLEAGMKGEVKAGRLGTVKVTITLPEGAS